MDYTFFLFSKLYELHNDDKIEYDLLFMKILDDFENWQNWDKINGANISEYDSINKYFKH